MVAKKGDLRDILSSQYETDKYKDFWLPWLEMVQEFLDKQKVKMVYEWSIPNSRLEFATVFTVAEEEYLTITYCDWGRAPDQLRKEANTFIQRIIYEKSLKEKALN